MACFRLRVFDISQDPSRGIHCKDVHELSDLQIYPNNNTTQPTHASSRIYLLEANKSALENSCEQSIIQSFISRVGCPESILKRHALQGATFAFNENVVIPRLAPQNRCKETFVVEYFDLQTFTGDPNKLSIECSNVGAKTYPGQDSRFPLICCQTGRQIQSHEWHDRSRSMLLIVPRKCTFWSRKTESGGSDGTSTLHHLLSAVT